MGCCNNNCCDNDSNSFKRRMKFIDLTINAIAFALGLMVGQVFSDIYKDKEWENKILNNKVYVVTNEVNSQVKWLACNSSCTNNHTEIKTTNLVKKVLVNE